ncbi:MAG: MORN repeat-containing protein [Flavobacterium sp.]
MNVKPKDGIGIYKYKDGSVYDGNWKGGKRHGKGIYKYSDGAVYEGEWKQDKQHGTGTFEQGSVKYVGDFVNDRLEGKGTLTNQLDGSIYVGDFVRDEFEGNGNLIKSNGDKYVGEFKKGKLHGNGTYTWMNGDVYTGEHADGLRNGNGKMTHSDGTITAGIWVKGKCTQEYPKLKVTKSAFNDCEDVFYTDPIVTGDIIVLHNQTVKKYMFDTDTTIGLDTTIGEKQNTPNICTYMFLKSSFDKYIKEGKTSNPNTRETMTEDNCKTYLLIIIDEDESKPKSRSPMLRARSRSRSRSKSEGGKRTRRRV